MVSLQSALIFLPFDFLFEIKPKALCLLVYSVDDLGSDYAFGSYYVHDFYFKLSYVKTGVTFVYIHLRPEGSVAALAV